MRTNRIGSHYVESPFQCEPERDGWRRTTTTARSHRIAMSGGGGSRRTVSKTRSGRNAHGQSEMVQMVVIHSGDAKTRTYYMGIKLHAIRRIVERQMIISTMPRGFSLAVVFINTVIQRKLLPPFPDQTFSRCRRYLLVAAPNKTWHKSGAMEC